MDGCAVPFASEVGCRNDKMTALQLNKMKNQSTPPGNHLLCLITTHSVAFCMCKTP